MHKIEKLLLKYNFKLQSQLPIESEQNGMVLECVYQQHQVTLMYYSDNEIYLIGEEGLFKTSLQDNNNAETIASLPYALNQIKQQLVPTQQFVA